MVHEIENGVEIPKRTSQRASKYPFEKMEIGQSFKVLDKNPSSAVSQRNKRDVEKRFIVRKEEGGYRVWRVELKS